jgi:hypothetical protein
MHLNGLAVEIEGFLGDHCSPIGKVLLSLFLSCALKIALAVKRPDFTPAHQVLFETGMIAGIGGLVFELPIMCDSRTKPDAGKIFDIGMDFI